MPLAGYGGDRPEEDCKSPIFFREVACASLLGCFPVRSSVAVAAMENSLFSLKKLLLVCHFGEICKVVAHNSRRRSAAKRCLHMSEEAMKYFFLSISIIIIVAQSAHAEPMSGTDDVQTGDGLEMIAGDGTGNAAETQQPSAPLGYWLSVWDSLYAQYAIAADILETIVPYLPELDSGDFFEREKAMEQLAVQLREITDLNDCEFLQRMLLFITEGIGSELFEQVFLGGALSLEQRWRLRSVIDAFYNLNRDFCLLVEAARELGGDLGAGTLGTDGPTPFTPFP